MSIADSNAVEIVPLDWDTQQFGFRVARLRALHTPRAQIESLIVEAQRLGVEMLVVVTDCKHRLPDELLARFGGLLADDKVTFVRTLGDAEGARTGTPSVYQARGGSVVDDILIEPFTGRDATTELVDLSIAAGEYSRFRVDPRFPRREFENLYRLWMQRSVRHELADAVLVARTSQSPEPLLGMVTLSVTDGIGSIGLIAVTAQARGRGIGMRLIDGAHSVMCEHGAQSAYVVTQATNQPACRHYLRAGYTQATTERIYHFWLQST